MAQSKAQKKDDLREDAYPVTEDAPTRDDQIGAVVGDAGPEDSPVRTQRPDQPIAAVMAGGVGEHKPPDSDVHDPDGRFKGDVTVADNTDAAEREKR